MKNINSIHLRKQGKRAVCHKIVDMEYHMTDKVEAASCRTCLRMVVKKLKLIANQDAEKFHINLI